jgi:hypothetical protein
MGSDPQESITCPTCAGHGIVQCTLADHCDDCEDHGDCANEPAHTMTCLICDGNREISGSAARELRQQAREDRAAEKADDDWHDRDDAL